MMTERALEADALRAKVEELTLTTVRLKEAQRQLVRSEQMASVGRLSAGLAHEIGNPLAAILGMEDLLLEGGMSAEEQRDFLARMKKETERISGVIRDLLDFARPEGGAADLDERPRAPADVWSVVETFRARANRRSRSRPCVSCSTAAARARARQVALSAQRLTQVLLNVS